MENLIIFMLVIVLAFYPYFLIIRFLQLGCKAFKKYLKQDDDYYLYTDNED